MANFLLPSKLTQLLYHVRHIRLVFPFFPWMEVKVHQVHDLSLSLDGATCLHTLFSLSKINFIKQKLLKYLFKNCLCYLVLLVH